MAERAKVLRAKHSGVKLSPEEFVRIANWLDASCQYYPSYWGQKNLKHHASPYFRPAVAFDDAISAQWPVGLRGLYEPAVQQTQTAAPVTPGAGQFRANTTGKH